MRQLLNYRDSWQTMESPDWQPVLYKQLFYIERVIDVYGVLPEVPVSSDWKNLYQGALRTFGWCYDPQTSGIVYTQRNGSFLAKCGSIHPPVLSADGLSEHSCIRKSERK